MNLKALTFGELIKLRLAADMESLRRTWWVFLILIVVTLGVLWYKDRH